ncbi:hypothetical protein BASA61_006738 [Batrachochytrium salamandrivorans]|nr:hypothetical protein BASA61_006738 [Batrachochytrium salamandrivorans]
MENKSAVGTTRDSFKKLKRLLLRYYPPGIIIEYEQDSQLKQRMVDLLDFNLDSNPYQVAQQILKIDATIPPAKAPQLEELLTRLHRKMVAMDRPRYELVKTLRTHVMPLTNCVFTKAGDRFITGSYDRLCKIWDTANGTELRSLEGHNNVVYALAFNNPYGDKIATGSFDKTAKIWDSNTGKCLHSLTGHTKEVVCLSFNPHSSLLATGSMDCVSILWDVCSGNEVRRLKGHSGEIVSLSFSQDGALVLTGSFDSTLNIWDMRCNSPAATLIGHRAEISNAQFNFSGTNVLSGSIDCTARIWDITSGKCLYTLM